MLEMKTIDKNGKMQDVSIPEEVQHDLMIYFAKRMDCFMKKGEKVKRIIYEKQLVVVSDTKQILAFGNSKPIHNIKMIFWYLKIKLLIKMGICYSEAWDKDVYLMRGMTNVSKFIGMSEEDLIRRFVDKASKGGKGGNNKE